MLRLVVLMASCAGAAIVSENTLLARCTGEPASDTLAVKLNVPDAVGVPASAPLVESVIPAGKLPPATVHTYAGVPPVAARAAL